ncbi:MAG: hypothetical protein IID09_08335 [Candidatus Hydrogenedentes bacterium]|nr:hypothetical protein [Candidatus Hydrogenedentota bacterium]
MARDQEAVSEMASKITICCPKPKGPPTPERIEEAKQLVKKMFVDPKNDLAKRPPENPTQQEPGVCAQRHANTDLSMAARDRERHHGIDARGRQRQDGEERERQDECRQSDPNPTPLPGSGRGRGRVQTPGDPDGPGSFRGPVCIPTGTVGTRTA